MPKNYIKDTLLLLKNTISSKKRKYLLLFFSTTLIICILLILITSLYLQKTTTRIDYSRKMETYRAYLDSYIKTLESVVEKCSENFYSEVNTSMPMISIVNSKEETWYIANAITNRALLELGSMTQRNFIFKEAYFYIPRLNDVYTSDSLYSELTTCPSYIQEAVDIYNNIENKNSYGIFRTSDSFIVYEEAFPYKNSPRAIIFLNIDTKALSDYLSSVYSSTLEGVQISVKYKDEVLWQTHEDSINPAGNYEYIESSSNSLGWTFLLQIPETSLTALAIDPQFLGFYIFLVIIFGVLSLVAAIIMFKPVYSITEAIDKSGIGSSSEKSYADVIENISSRQKELDNALVAVADEVLRNLFLDLLRGHTKSNSTVQSLLEGIKSTFTPFALYSTICIMFDEKDKQNIQNSEQTIKAFLIKQDVYNDSTSIILPYSDDSYVIVLQFNKASATIPESKARLKSLVSELTLLMNSRDVDCKINFGLLCHSVLDIDLSLKNAISEQASTISHESTIMERIQLVLKALENGNVQDFTSAMSRVNEMLTSIDDISKLREESTMIINVLNEAVGNSSDFSLIIESFSNRDDIILKYNEAEKNFVKTAISQIGKIQNPYLIKARSYINEYLKSSNLSLTTIADSIGITPSYLSKLFSDNMGIKLIDYIAQERIKRSMKMLTDTDISILEIAVECGFVSSRNYISAFRKIYNTTPGEFRKSRKLI